MNWSSKSIVGLILALVYFLPALIAVGFAAHCVSAFMDIGACEANGILMLLVSLPISGPLSLFLSLSIEEYVIFYFVIASVVYIIALYGIGHFIENIYKRIKYRTANNL